MISAKKILPIAAFIACVLISNKYCAGYWVVGPVFAAAYLIANFEKARKKSPLKLIAFAVSSTLVYAWVYWIVQHGWNLKNNLLEMLLGSLTAAVILGSIVMPFVHSLIFSSDAKTLRKTAIAMILSWYAVSILSWLDDSLNIPGNINYMFFGIVFWQGIYFWFLKI